MSFFYSYKEKKSVVRIVILKLFKLLDQKFFCHSDDRSGPPERESLVVGYVSFSTEFIIPRSPE